VLRNHFRIMFSSVVMLSGCAMSQPYVQPSPIPDEVGWQAPVVEPPAAPAEPMVSAPQRPASPSEQVFAYDEGHVQTVKVGINHPLSVMLQPGETIDQLMWDDRAPITPGEEGSPWDIREGVSHTPPRPHVLMNVTKPGLSQGVTITTNRRVYLLDVRSVAVSKVRLVRWDYGPEPLKKVAAKPKQLPDLTQPQTFYAGYMIDPLNKDRVPSWTPRQVVHDQQGKTYIVFPSYVTTIQAPLLRLVGTGGPEIINYRQVGTVYILDGLFNMAELRVGTGDRAEVVRIYRGTPQALQCSGDTNCPVWSERIAAR
jgi:type IV secretion system protein TrbG